MQTYLMKTLGLSVLSAAVAVALTGCGSETEQPTAQKTDAHAGHDHAAGEEHAGAKPAAPAGKADDYPLDVCIVSGQKLGSMGEPVVIQHEGRTVKFCCQGCVAAFKKAPAEYLAKLDAAKAGKPAQEK